MLRLRAVLAQGGALLRLGVAARSPWGGAPPCLRSPYAGQVGRHASSGAQPPVVTAASGGSGGPQPAGAAAASYQEWREMWLSFLRQLYEGGHYAADPGVRADDLESEPGAMKRAVLSLARERSEILFGLDSGKLKAITLAGFPSDDRKTRNAFKRLQASVVEGRHLPPAEGGPAELQDVMRLILSLAQCSRREVELFRPLLLAAYALLPDIAAAAAAPPTPEALAAAAEAQAAHQRFRPGRLRGELQEEPERRADGSRPRMERRGEGGRPRTERSDRQRPRQQSDREWDEWSGRPQRGGPPGGRGGRGSGRGSGRGPSAGRGGRGGGHGRGSGAQQQQGGGDQWYSGGSRGAE